MGPVERSRWVGWLLFGGAFAFLVSAWFELLALNSLMRGVLALSAAFTAYLLSLLANLQGGDL